MGVNMAAAIAPAIGARTRSRPYHAPRRHARPLTRVERVLGGSVPCALEHARALWATYNDGKNRPILTAPDGNVKLGKNGRPTYSLAIAPAAESGIAGVNVCPWSTVECRAVCLATAGRNAFGADVRTRRTRFMVDHPAAFKALVLGELAAAIRRHGAIGFRFNALSDIRIEWAFVELLDMAAASAGSLVLYDYTKARPIDRDTRGGLLDLTYSVADGWTDADIVAALDAGMRVALVASKLSPWHDRIGGTWHGYPVIDGDATDQRRDDPAPAVVVLAAKGRARALEPGPDRFVRS